MNRGKDGTYGMRTDMEERMNEKKKILPKIFMNKEKSGRRKLKLELEQTLSLLGHKTDDPKGTDRANNNAQPVVESPKEESCQKFFGVKNYLHNFYESVSIKNPQLYEDIPAESSAPFKATRNCRLCWKVGIAVGLVTAFIGLVLILVGFVTPLHTTIAAKNEGFLIIDRSATQFNESMRTCRLIGIGLFLTGFCLFLAVVLFALCWNIDEGASDMGDEESAAENFCLPFAAEEDSRAIPATEELSAVQPERHPDETVVNKSGLIVPPPAVLQIKSEK